ncbi:MAG: pyruvate kinase [Bacteroidales bacterium]|nr:pyruvate kinase [Candidatus Physcocola equi]
MRPSVDKKTKIIATISDFHCEESFIRQLFENGMNIVRLNTAHLSQEGMDKIINNVRAVSSEIGILIDTKGPEVRTTMLACGDKQAKLPIKKGETVKIYGRPDQLTDTGVICVNYAHFVDDVHPGIHILIDDGEIDLLVTAKENDCLVCEAQNDAMLGNRKGVNVPGVRINLPSITPKDRENILFAIDRKLDFIAHSFVRSNQDVKDVTDILRQNNSHIRVIAKIENQEGIDNIDGIIDACDGIMIARGDLGIEVPQETIPGIQRILIRKCVVAKKPVIVATQMLQSMISNPRPTRAEVTDIANAIFYRTDALMLSGETAQGKYPVEAVRTMAKIAAESEKTKLKDNDIRIPYRIEDNDIASFLAKQAVESIDALGVRALVTDSHTGKTARYLAAYRGDRPVLAMCYNELVIRHLSISYGVIPFYQKQKEGESKRAYFLKALQMLLDHGYLHLDDKVAYLSGDGRKGQSATFLEINTIEHIFADARAVGLNV